MISDINCTPFYSSCTAPYTKNSLRVFILMSQASIFWKSCYNTIQNHIFELKVDV